MKEIKEINWEELSVIGKFKVICGVIFLYIALYVGLYNIYLWMFTKICSPKTKDFLVKLKILKVKEVGDE